MMNPAERICITRILEYDGPREWVEGTLNSPSRLPDGETMVGKKFDERCLIRSQTLPEGTILKEIQS